MPESENTQWDRQCLEAMKSLGKTLGQMTLYKIGHPAVSATLKIAEDHLAEALGQTPQGELAFVIDQDKLIANGRIIGAVNSLPNSIPGLFNRFKLNSLTFKSGLTNQDLSIFCELAASRPDPAVSANPQGYLSEKGASHIIFNEAVYSKTGETTPPPAQAPAAEESPVGEIIGQAIQEQSIDKTIQVLVDRAVPDPASREKVFEQVMRLLREDIARRIEEVVRPIKREKAILQNEQTRTQTVLSNMVEGVIVVDEQGKILMMNPAAEQIYGTNLAKAAGVHLAEKTGEDHVVTLAAELKTPGEEPISKEVKVSGVEDTARTVKASGAVVQNEAGKVVGMVSSLTDVAKHKELQRMQRDFIAHVTHELRAPLSSIRAALEILQGETASTLKEEQGRMLTTALKNSDRLSDLISSILDFSKIESGQMTVYPKKEDAEKIAREGVESLAAWASKKRISVSLAAAPELPPVQADSSRTIQVLVNLLSNAIKFTPVGGQITVRVGPSQSGGGFAGNDKYVEYAVSDTGTGIAKADQKRIFEKFVQIASGELHVGGTGLGLAIAKALIHLQGGKMWVESDLGKGATFFFTLPLYVVSKEGQLTPLPAPVKLAWWKRLLGLKK